MTWISESEDEAEFFREISTLSDRVAGLLAPVILERRLLSVIKSRWRDAKTRGGSAFAELFSPNGELANHDSRLRIGLAMGLYSTEAFEEMRYITKIRNAFAHQLGAKDFGAQPICDFIPQLKIVDGYPTPKRSATTGPISRDMGLAAGQDALFRVFIEASAIEDIESPRNRYLRTIEIFSILMMREELRPSQGKPYF